MTEQTYGPFRNGWWPEPDELRTWAYDEHRWWDQDFEITVAELPNLEVLVDVVSDPSCAMRTFLRQSLYCLVGHGDREDPRLRAGVEQALATGEPWVSTWAVRVAMVLARPEGFDRFEWCGWEGLWQQADDPRLRRRYRIRSRLGLRP